MLTNEKGLYAIRLQESDTKKELIKIDPEKIEFDFATNEFIGFLDSDEGVDPTPKFLEFYFRKDPKTIPYKKESKAKLNLKDVELCLRAPAV